MLRFLLLPFSLLYFIGLLFARWLRSRCRASLSKPVISIGNLTVGGTGKTPLLIRLATELTTAGHHPAILSRGYGHDEIALMSEKCPDVPIGVGSDRVKSAQELLATQKIDSFLLDDGFQHWPIARELDIVCIDASRPLSCERMLPRGTLREPLSGLRRAGLVILTRTELATPEEIQKLRTVIKKVSPSVPVLASRFENELIDPVTGEKWAWDKIRGKNVVAVSAIGNPKAFEKGLSKQGAVVTPLRYRDHHMYSVPDIEKIKQDARDNAALILTTEKDWMKLKAASWLSGSLLVSQITLVFSAEDEAIWSATIKKVLP